MPTIMIVVFTMDRVNLAMVVLRFSSSFVFVNGLFLVIFNARLMIAVKIFDAIHMTKMVSTTLMTLLIMISVLIEPTKCAQTLPK